MQEVWKDVVGFEQYFKVSRYGGVYSKRSGKILKQHTNRAGYKTLATKIGGRDGEAYCFKVHRLVAEAFLPEPSEELKEICKAQGYGLVIVRHLDSDPSNCSVDNLAWGSSQDNADDMVAAGTHLQSVAEKSGERNVHAKLSLERVEQIRKRYVPMCRENGSRALAKEFGVHHSQISRYVSRQKYRD